MKKNIPNIGIFRLLLILIFASLCFGLVFAFIKRPDTSELNITGEIQTGSSLTWKLEPKTSTPRVIIPSWARMTTWITAKRIRFMVDGGKHVFLDIFVDPRSEILNTHPHTPHSSTLILEANEPFRAQVGSLASGTMKFHERGHFGLVIPEASTFLVRGEREDKFYLDFSEVTYNFGMEKPNGIWGEFPSIILTSDPPKYQHFDEQGVIRFTLVSQESSLLSRLGPGIYVMPDIDGYFDMSLAVSDLTLSGFTNGSLVVDGSTRGVSPSDSITASFSSSEPGQVLIENEHGDMSISGVANTITKNGTDLRPRELATWPWWIQSFYLFAMGLCSAQLLGPICKQWIKRLKAASEQ